MLRAGDTFDAAAHTVVSAWRRPGACVMRLEELGLQAEFGQAGMIRWTRFASVPMEQPGGGRDRQIVDAGMAKPHQAVLVKFDSITTSNPGTCTHRRDGAALRMNLAGRAVTERCGSQPCRNTRCKIGTSRSG
jgi:hypothetical protein